MVKARTCSFAIDEEASEQVRPRLVLICSDELAGAHRTDGFPGWNAPRNVNPCRERDTSL